MLRLIVTLDAILALAGNIAVVTLGLLLPRIVKLKITYLSLDSALRYRDGRDYRWEEAVNEVDRLSGTESTLVLSGRDKADLLEQIKQHLSRIGGLSDQRVEIFLENVRRGNPAPQPADLELGFRRV